MQDVYIYYISFCRFLSGFLRLYINIYIYVFIYIIYIYIYITKLPNH